MKARIKNYCYITLGTVFLGGMMFSSCKKNNTTPNIQQKATAPTNPDGADSSNQIASANLVDFWTLNGNANDSKGSLNGTNSGGTYATGMLSGTQAWQGSTSNYSYIGIANAGSTLPALTSFSVSTWINAAQPQNNPGAVPVPGLGEQCFFDLVNDSAWQGNIHLGLTSFTSAGSDTTLNSDTLQMKVILSNFASGVVWNNYYVTAYLDTAVGKWTQVAITYNSATSMLNVYENGVAVAISGPYTTYPGSVGLELYVNDPGSLANTPGIAGWGAVQFKNATALALGAWGINTTPALSAGGIQPWAGNYPGSMERVRVYNSSLTAADVNSLYILEKAGF